MGQQQNVKIDLVSSADASGFTKFESAYNTLSAARNAHIQGNESLLASERKVRVNLVDLTNGLFQAQSATEAVSVSIAHLSEVFEVGFAGTVIAGVAAAVISIVGKAQKELQDLGEEIDKQTDKVQGLAEKFSGVELSPQTKNQREIDQASKEYADQEAKLNEGGIIKGLGMFLGDVGSALGIPGIGTAPSILFDRDRAKLEAQRQAIQEAQNIAGNPAFMQEKEDRDQAAKDAANRQRDRENEERSAARLAESNQKLAEQTMTPAQHEASLKQQIGLYGGLAQSDFDEGTPGGNARGNEALIKRNDLQQQYNTLVAEQKKEQQAAAEAVARESAEKAKQLAEQRAREAAAAERQEEREEKDDSKTSHIRATILAGTQRAQGGGGAAYSLVTRDPVVEEARKHTALLTDIAASVKTLDSRSSPMPAAFA